MQSRVLPVQIFDCNFPAHPLFRRQVVAATTRADRWRSVVRSPPPPPAYQRFGYTAALRSIRKRTRARGTYLCYKYVELRVFRPQMIICSRVASHHCGRSDRWISPVSQVFFACSRIWYLLPGTWPSMSPPPRSQPPPPPTPPPFIPA